MQKSHTGPYSGFLAPCTQTNKCVPTCLVTQRRSQTSGKVEPGVSFGLLLQLASKMGPSGIEIPKTSLLYRVREFEGKHIIGESVLVRCILNLSIASSACACLYSPEVCCKPRLAACQCCGWHSKQVIQRSWLKLCATDSSILPESAHPYMVA